MKKLACLVLIILSLKAVAQNDTTFSKKVPAAINNWGGRTVVFLPGYWDMAVPQLKQTLNEKLVNRIVGFSIPSTYPGGLVDIIEAENTVEKNDLKMYWVATFDNNFNNEFHGKDVVLWLPKADNQAWNKNITWNNDIFIVIPLTDVELLGVAN